MINRNNLKISEELLETILVMSIILFNVLGLYLSKITNIDSVFFPLVFTLLFFFYVIFTHNNIYLHKPITAITILSVLLCIIQLVFYDSGLHAIKMIIQLLVVLLISQYNSHKCWEHFQKFIVYLSLILSIDAIIELPKIIALGYNYFNVRNYTMVDKPYYSLFLTLAILYLIIDLMIHKANKYQNISLICLFSSVLFIIFQSKSFIICIFLGLIILFSKFKRKKVYNFKNLSLCIIVIFLLITYYSINPNAIPLHIKGGLNNFFGIYFDNDYDVYKQTITYAVRGEILNFAFNLWKESPVFGIGFGNYAKYSLGAGIGTDYNDFPITDIESSFLSLIVEGGLAFTFLHFLMIIILLLKIKSKIDTIKSIKYVSIYMTIIVYSVFNLMNDYMFLSYWIILGIILSALNINNTSVKSPKSQS